MAQQYHRPSIIDIKVGYQTWYPGAEEDYIQRCQAKDAATTQAALGFKVCGMQVGGRACESVMYERPATSSGPCAAASTPDCTCEIFNGRFMICCSTLLTPNLQRGMHSCALQGRVSCLTHAKVLSALHLEHAMAALLPC